MRERSARVCGRRERECGRVCVCVRERERERGRKEGRKSVGLKADM